MKILAVDLGLKRIGLAYAPTPTMAIPINPISRKNRNQAAKELDDLIQMYNIDVVVFGVANDEFQKRCSHFASLLTSQVKIEYFDEAHTSLEAKELGVGEHGRSGRFDSLSAMILLQRYLKI